MAENDMRRGSNGWMDGMWIERETNYVRAGMAWYGTMEEKVKK